MPVPIDPEKYRNYLSESGWTERRKDEYLNALWKLMSTFVDAAWGVDPAQTATPSLTGSFVESGSELFEAKHGLPLTQENRSRTRTTKPSTAHPRKTRTKGR